MALFAGVSESGDVQIENEHCVIEALSVDAARQLAEMLSAAIDAAAEVVAEQPYTRYPPRRPTAGESEEWSHA